MHTVPHHPVLDSPPASCLPSYDPLAATVGMQTPGMERETLWARDHSYPVHPIAINHGSPLWSICGCHIQPSKFQPLGGCPTLGVLGTKDHGRLVPRSRSPGRLCCCSCVPVWGCSSVATHVLQPDPVTPEETQEKPAELWPGDSLGWNPILCTKNLWVQSPVRAHTWVAGSIPGQHIGEAVNGCFSHQCFPLPFSKKIQCTYFWVRVKK